MPVNDDELDPRRSRLGAREEEAEHPLLANDEGEDTHDEDPSNMMFRAGYLAGMAMKLEGDDRKILMRSGRSLVLAARMAAVSIPEPEEWADRATTEDAAIQAAFPTRSGRHDLYGQAMHLVGDRHSKGALVALVTWLLLRIEARKG